jgi:hypothetical protein
LKRRKIHKRGNQAEKANKIILASGRTQNTSNFLKASNSMAKTGTRFRSTLKPGPVPKLDPTLKSFSGKCKNREF